MRILLLIGTGGFIGCVFRYLLSYAIQNKYPSLFPFATLTVNIIGCLVIGMLFGLNIKYGFPKEWLIFLAPGICGGFTTYSAFSLESFELIKNGFMWQAMIYIFVSILLGLLATFAGYTLIKFISTS